MSAPAGTQGPECEADMATVSTAFDHIRAAIAAVEQLIGPHTWSGAPADAWSQGEWGVPKQQLINLMNNCEQDEAGLIQAASQKPQLNPKIRGISLY